MRFAKLPTLAASLATACLLFMATLTAHGADVPADKRLPKEVLLYVSTPSLPQMRAAFESTSLWELVHDPEVKKFKDHVTEKIQKALADLKDAASESDIEFKDLPGLLAGEITFAVTKPFGEPLGGALLMEVGEKKALLDKLLDELDKANDELSRTKESVQGVDVTVCKVDEVEIRYFVKDGMFVVCSSLPLVESVLARWDGKHEQTFASHPIYTEIVNKCKSREAASGRMTWFINPISLISAGMAMSPDAAIYAALFNDYLPALGLDSFKGMGGVTEVNVGDFEMVSRSLYYNEPPARGIPRFFTLRASVTSPPGWVPANAGQFTAFDWDLKAAYDSAKMIYENILGQDSFAPMIDSLQKQPGAPNLHLKNDVVDVLTGLVQLSMSPPKDIKEPQKFDGAITIGVVDDVRGKKILSELLKIAPQDQVKTIEVNGVTVYTPAGEDQAGAAAVANNSIIVASSVDNLKAVIANKASTPLVDNPSFQAARRAIPSSVGVLNYLDVATQWQGAYEAARKGELNSLTEGELDFSLLPPFEAISKYLQPVADYGMPDEHGYFGAQFQLKRPR